MGNSLFDYRGLNMLVQAVIELIRLSKDNSPEKNSLYLDIVQREGGGGGSNLNLNCPIGADFSWDSVPKAGIGWNWLQQAGLGWNRM